MNRNPRNKGERSAKSRISSAVNNRIGISRNFEESIPKEWPTMLPALISCSLYCWRETFGFDKPARGKKPLPRVWPPPNGGGKIGDKSST
jgi:hypothetical protein